jgi:hypothetical protein
MMMMMMMMMMMIIIIIMIISRLQGGRTLISGVPPPPLWQHPHGALLGSLSVAGGPRVFIDVLRLSSDRTSGMGDQLGDHLLAAVDGFRW